MHDLLSSFHLLPPEPDALGRSSRSQQSLGSTLFLVPRDEASLLLLACF